MTFQFKIQLKDISEPKVWRRVLVPAELNFLQFHMVIQSAFGWDDAHWFLFSPKGWRSNPTIKLVDLDDLDNDDNDEYNYDEDCIKPTKVKLCDIFTAEKQKYTYIYDFGDDWYHQITLEKILEEKVLHARCIKANGACPPEDCGGAWGYENLKVVLADTKHPNHKNTKQWLGMSPKGKWDEEAFDLEFINQELLEIE